MLASLIITYVNGSQLKAFVPAAGITDPGTATITVYTPAPLGGGLSNSLSIEIKDSFSVFLPITIR
jgi:hypothetical protein